MKKVNLQRKCIPIKIFDFPTKKVEITRSMTTQVLSSNKKNTFTINSSFNQFNPMLSRSRLFRSSSSKIMLEKSLTIQAADCSFFDYGLEEKKLYKIKTENFKSEKIKEKKEDRISFSISIESFYKNPGVYSPAALIKRPLKVKKTLTSLQDPHKDWIIFDTFTMAKPINHVFLRKKFGNDRIIQGVQPKRKVLALIPQPIQYCKTPLTINNESID